MLACHKNGGFKQSQGLILVKSEYDFGKVGV